MIVSHENRKRSALAVSKPVLVVSKPILIGRELWIPTSEIDETNQRSKDWLRSKKKKRREGDSNSRYLAVRRFSKPVQSTTLPSLRMQNYHQK